MLFSFYRLISYRYNYYMEDDIRWKQRFQNYKKALAILKNAKELAASRELSDLEKQGVIQGFEFTFELAWNDMAYGLTERARCFYLQPINKPGFESPYRQGGENSIFQRVIGAIPVKISGFIPLSEKPDTPCML